TNATYVNNATVTLVEMDFGELIGDTAKLAQMSKIKTMDEAKKALQDLKGFKIDIGPEINIEFTGK
ncbi:MAG TPA: hypothetical protein VGQ81_01795, partial [Acidobacteriota bacterium]|nr:hypothetical protein [Acidobacteriota bacterium]